MEKETPRDWLESENERPITKLRKALMAIAKNPERDVEKTAAAIEEAASEWHAKTKQSAQAASRWLRSGEPTHPDLSTPEEQAIWGAALLCNKKSQSPHPEATILRNHHRLLREKGLMKTLLLGTIQNPKTTINWGKSGSWFYYNPNTNHINIDPGNALVLGLQNARAVLLHEIGHSQLTLERSPKILALQKRLEDLHTETKDGNKTILPENRKEAMKVAQELKYREDFWQLCEDACVNAYAELEGESLPINIPNALLRTYAILAPPNKKGEFETLMRIIRPEGEASQKLRKQLAAATFAHPISRHWMDTNHPENWESLGAELGPEGTQIVNTLANPAGSIATTQPGLQASREETSNPRKLEAITKKCADERNRLCDETFDSLFLPWVEQLPEPPNPPDGYSKKPKETEDLEEGELENNPVDGPSSLDQKPPPEEENGGKEKQEAWKKSSGEKSPLHTLPTCGNYQEAVEKCQPQIQYVAKLLKQLAISQEEKAPDEPSLLPNPQRGVQSFQISSFIERKKKELGGQTLTLDDRKHFLAPSSNKTARAITDIRFYIDGSGSQKGENAKNTMLSLIIFAEAAKSVPHINLTAVYSGASETLCLIERGNIRPEQEKLVAAILDSGYAHGGNEICPEGLVEMNNLTIKNLPRKGTVGTTHTIFLTDGFCAAHETERIAQAIKTLLDQNPQSTFDTIIMTKGTHTPFEAANAAIDPKRPKQKTTLSTASKANEICPVIVHKLLSRIREWKSLRPIPTATYKKNQLAANKEISQTLL